MEPTVPVPEQVLMRTAIKILHWNINGIRAISKKNVYKSQSFESYLLKQKADIIVFTETKISDDKRCDEINALFKSYPYHYHTHAEKKGYSGVSIYSKIEPIRQLHPNIDNSEGRIIALEYNKFILIGTYIPNSGAKLLRLSYRINEWDKQFLRICKQLIAKKSLVIVGDMNVAHMDIDINHPEKHHMSSGFTDQERGNFDKLLRECNLLDSWRIQHPNKIGYTYFDYRTKARQRNAGWRIDYILITADIQHQLLESNILSNVVGSDHIPITCLLQI